MASNDNNLITKILLVDDDENHAVLIRKMMKKAGLTNEMLLFENGIDFKEYLAANPPGSDKYLVLLDINLPLLNGFQILEKLRMQYAYEELPVVVISTTARKSDIEQAYSLGCNAFLKKPISFDDLQYATDDINVVLSTETASTP